MSEIFFQYCEIVDCRCVVHCKYIPDWKNVLGSKVHIKFHEKCIWVIFFTQHMQTWGSYAKTPLINELKRRNKNGD